MKSTRRHGEPLRLLDQRAHDARVRVTMADRGVRAHHVEIAAAFDIEERAPLPARHHDGRLAVIVDQQAAAGCDEIVLLRHGATLPSLVGGLGSPDR